MDKRQDFSPFSIYEQTKMSNINRVLDLFHTVFYSLNILVRLVTIKTKIFS